MPNFTNNGDQKWLSDARWRTALFVALILSSLTLLLLKIRKILDDPYDSCNHQHCSSSCICHHHNHHSSLLLHSLSTWCGNLDIWMTEFGWSLFLLFVVAISSLHHGCWSWPTHGGQPACLLCRMMDRLLSMYSCSIGQNVINALAYWKRKYIGWDIQLSFRPRFWRIMGLLVAWYVSSFDKRFFCMPRWDKEKLMTDAYNSLAVNDTATCCQETFTLGDCSPRKRQERTLTTWQDFHTLVTWSHSSNPPMAHTGVGQSQNWLTLSYRTLMSKSF